VRSRFACNGFESYSVGLKITECVQISVDWFKGVPAHSPCILPSRFFSCLFRTIKSVHWQIHAFDDHLFTSCKLHLYPWKGGVIVLHFSWRVAEKDCTSSMGYVREHFLPLLPPGRYQVTFSSQATRRWARECHRKQDALAQPFSDRATLPPHVSFFLIGSEDKISACAWSQLSLNEAVIERWATVRRIGMRCVTRQNENLAAEISKTIKSMESMLKRIV